MSSRLVALIVALGLAVGIVFGLTVGILTLGPAVTVATDAVQLGQPEQDDFIIMVAEAYAGDGQLALARDRLARLGDNAIETRIEKLALSYAPQHDLISTHLALLSVALGSRNPALIMQSATSTPIAASSIISTPTSAPTLVLTDKPTAASTATSTPTRIRTGTPTATRVVLRIPAATRTSPPAPTSVAVPASLPPRPVVFQPDPSRWPGSVHYYPAQVKPGEGYWHLAKVLYCDAFDKSDPRIHDFGCDEMAGGPAGTSIYVMTGGAPIDIIRPDGVNIAYDPSMGTDMKSPNDMCNCTYSFEASAYRISVRGAPSDAIDGFCLCSVNFGWGSRAHVRYFLYFEYIKR